MALASTEPRPCADPSCHGPHAPGERVALAMSLCRARGAHLTELRRQILELLWEGGRTMGAYELMEALKQRESRSVAPTTVYRALEFLMSQGLVARIESRNAYIPRIHPERQRDCLFFLCSDCGTSAELEYPRVGRLISEMAARVGFRPTRQVVEVQGICARCMTSGAA